MSNEQNESEAKAHPVDALVMCIDERYSGGDPASPEDTTVSFFDAKGNTVCRMEFYSDQECDEIYCAVMRYSRKLGIKHRYTSNVNNHYYT